MGEGQGLGGVTHLRLGALVLAAGAGHRFGGDKLVAELDGRPLLQHVLDTVAAVRPVVTLVVIAPAMRGMERLAWHGARRLVNREPERGLSSSVRLGLEASASEPGVDGVFILLGDQPRIAVVTLLALAREASSALADGAVAVVPGYAEGGGANPVLLLRAGFALAGQLGGDHGLGALIGSRPGLVRRVSVPGSNPDVDTVADLQALQGEPYGAAD
jgi:molybdenum cofactor cytidylyltransferase